MAINPYQAPGSNVEPTPAPAEIGDFVSGGARLPSGQGWEWLVEGFALFRKAPGIWIAMLIIWMIIAAVLNFIPLATNLATPFATAGFMLGCRALERGEDLEIGHLFAGFQSNVLQLILIGVFTLVGIIAALIPLGIIAAVFGGIAMAMGITHSGAPEILIIAGVMLGVVLLLVLLTPVIMAIYYAAPLVVFHELTAIEAMKHSLRGCWRNIWPLTVYGAVVIGLAVASVFTLFLGLLVLIPVLICSHYVSYKAIFVAPRHVEPEFGAKVSLTK